MAAVGTIPDNEDKRPPDLIADSQIQRAAADPETFSETPRPSLPQIPNVVPPNIEDMVREAAVGVFRDLAKNITINGQTPEVTGKSISFEIPTTPPASSQFVQMNMPEVLAPQPAARSGQVAAMPTILQQMELDSEARNAPKTSRQRNEEEMDERMARKLQADPTYKPSALASNEEKASFERVTNPSPSIPGHTPNQLTPALNEQIIASVKPSATGDNWLDTSSDNWDKKENKPKFGEEKNRLPGETKSEQETREQKEYNQQSKQYKSSVQAVKEERPGQRSGEGERHYTERMNKERGEGMNDLQAAAVKNGDSSYFYKGFIPILFTRKDGQRKILARIDNTHSAVIEGATGNERQGTLPPDDGYYLAGGEDSCLGLGLYTKAIGSGNNQQIQIWVNAGQVAGVQISDQSVASSGSGTVYANVNFNGNTGAISGASVSNSQNGDASIALGSYAYSGNSASVTNFDCGSVYANVCRNWFAVSAPFFGLSLTR